MASVYRKLLNDKLTVFSISILIIVLLCSFLAPFIAPYNPYHQSLAERRKGPSQRHWLGTDEFGRDILSRLIYGARNTLLIGVLSVSIGLFIGTFLGLIAGYYGGFIDILIMRIIDLMLAFPYFLLAILIVATLGPGMINSTIAIGIASVPDYSRVVRGAVLTIRGKLFIQAEVALGSGDPRIIFSHVLPNVFAPIIVLGTLRLASSILGGAGLGFLGLGTQPPNPEWGVMLSGGRSFLIDAPHISLFPGVALALLVLAFNLFGDTLRDYLDPRLKQ
jgi:ABC-type dipeptide/oligopeptide/nickel transport system permease subunit